MDLPFFSDSADESAPSSAPFSRPALIAGAALGGAAAGLRLARWWIRQDLPGSASLPRALDAETRTVEGPAGRTNLYVRPGQGTPVVLLHSFNAVASSFEMKPIFERLAAATRRPVVAVDWLGFGRSARTTGPYRPQTYHDQLFELLTTTFEAPVDLVALSLGGEYAARAALQAAPQVRRLVLIAPTGLTSGRGPSAGGRFGLALAGATGLFELVYYRLTRPSSVRSFYERQVFLDPSAVPDALVDYASVTAHARNAHCAPRRFVDGSLFLPDVAEEVYARLYRPTLVLTPEDPGPTVQSFDRLPEVLAKNDAALRHRTLPGGLLPHWEAPVPALEAIEAFLEG
jgi:pimeloyl-ACP methyl ester carboxylesterase